MSMCWANGNSAGHRVSRSAIPHYRRINRERVSGWHAFDRRTSASLSSSVLVLRRRTRTSVQRATIIIPTDLASIFLAASPWLFGFNDAPPKSWMPHVVARHIDDRPAAAQPCPRETTDGDAANSEKSRGEAVADQRATRSCILPYHRGTPRVARVGHRGRVRELWARRRECSAGPRLRNGETKRHDVAGARRHEDPRSRAADRPGMIFRSRFPPFAFSRAGNGEGGIRTLGTLLEYGALAKRCFRPLSHLTSRSA